MSAGERFDRLIEIMATLRGPDGCPWDKQQDFNSLKPMLVEEVYEVLEAIENSDFDGLSEELGDLLFLVGFMVLAAGANCSVAPNMGPGAVFSATGPGIETAYANTHPDLPGIN